MRLLSLLLSILIPLTSLADNVAYVKVGEAAPFTGYLFSPEKESELRLLDSKYEFELKMTANLKHTIAVQDTLIATQNERIKVWMDQSNSLAKQLSEQKSDQFWKNTLYFIGGAFVTCVIAYGYSRAVR